MVERRRSRSDRSLNKNVNENEDNGHRCKDKNNGGKYKKVIKLGRLWIKDEIFSELNGMMLFNGKSSNHLIKYLFNAFF